MYSGGAATIDKMWGEKAKGANFTTAASIIEYYANLSETGVWTEMSLVIARPFIEHRMMSAVLAVAGRDTGATLFGPAGARWRLSGLCTHSPALAPSHPASRMRSQTCRSLPTRR